MQTIHALRDRDPTLGAARLAYAGRLDPMAEGVMLVLKDDEVHEAPRFQALDKTYRVGVLFGVATDTYDALGLVESTSPSSRDPDHGALVSAFAARVGSFPQNIPPFASYRVAGRPSFYWARQGLSEQMPRPSPIRSVHAIAFTGVEHIPSETLHGSIVDRITRVRGDFRQREILSQWAEVFAAQSERQWLVASVRIDCSSGTFMRGIAHEVGLALGSCALALTIERLRVGPYGRNEALRLERSGAS